MRKPAGSLGEVAKRCGVSQSTVSRVLNNSKAGRFSVSAEVQERILRVAKELNYRPSVAARNLTVAKTKLIAVLGVTGIYSDRVGPVDEAIGAAAEALDAAGYEICVQIVSKRHGAFDLPALRVDGVLAAAPKHLDDLAELEASGIPYVSIDGPVGPQGSQVVPDDAGGTRMALKHLVDLGHRRIAYLDHPAADATNLSVYERRGAFVAAQTELGFEASAHGLPPLPSDTPWDTYYEPFLRRAVIEGKATAVLTYSHHGALALLRTAHDLGLSVPRDVSLVCFNDEPVVRLTVPSITAVDVPAVRMGKVAADLLLRQLSSPDGLPPEQVRVPEQLTVRESTAKARG